MRKHQQKEIDGNTWTVNQFSSTEGARLFARLLQLFAGSVSKVLQSLPAGNLGSLLDAKLDFGVLGTAVVDLADRLDEDTFEHLIKRLLACTKCDGKDVIPQFETLFQGRYYTMIKVALFVVEVNYQLPLADLFAAPLQESDGKQAAG